MWFHRKLLGSRLFHWLCLEAKTLKREVTDKAHTLRVTEKGLGEILMCDPGSILQECVDCTHALNHNKADTGVTVRLLSVLPEK